MYGPLSLNLIYVCPLLTVTVFALDIRPVKSHL